MPPMKVVKIEEEKWSDEEDLPSVSTFQDFKTISKLA